MVQVNGLGKRSELWTPHREYLSLGAIPQDRQKQYRELFTHHVDGTLLEEIRTNTHKGMALGNDRFKDELTTLTGRRFKPKKDKWGQSKIRFNLTPTPFIMGQLTQESRVMNGVTYTTAYSYDNDFDLESVTYPSGLTVTYTRDTTGGITGTTADTQPITGQVTRLPFGPLKDMTFGSSVLNISRTYDQRYLLSQNSAGTILNHGYTRDSEGKVVGISGITDALPQGGATSYSHTANRLTSSTGQEPAQYTYDNYGNITADGTRTFTYNQNNRLSKVSEGTTTVAEYGYDGQGRRVFKTVSGSTTHYHYDPSGNLIAETSATGTPLRDIIYQDGERVAMKVYGSGAGTYWFINNHLGAPRAIINSSGQVVWKAAYLPFGKAEILVNTIENNFRLPGQYYDAETGLHYNMFRYYNPDTGRYITADPVGLSAGLNLFAYVGGDPVNFVDTIGLMVEATFDKASGVLNRGHL